MLINKTDSTLFRGYQHFIDDNGAHAYKFNYPHDNKSQNIKIEFYKNNASLDDEPVTTVDLAESPIISFDEMPEFAGDEPVWYRIYVNGKPIRDTGRFETKSEESEEGFNVIYRNGTFPLVRGQGVLTMPDIHRPGAYYADLNSEKPGMLCYDNEKQKASEKVIRTFSNKGGGSLAGVEYDLDTLRSMGAKKIFMTPIWGGDNISGHHYWNKNDMQISDDLGNIDNYESFVAKLFECDMQYVDDFAITSEGLEGINFQNALRRADKKPQQYYWFKLNGLNDGPLSLGVIPVHENNLRHRIINPSVIYDSENKSIKNNPEYNPHEKTYFEIYDATQVTDEQLSKKNEPIRSYKNIQSKNKLLINSSDDTLVPYCMEIEPKEYKNRLEEFVKMNKNLQAPIELNSPEGTMFIGQFTHFKISTNAEGAVFWDANKDILKRNFFISGYDEKILNRIPNLNQRAYERELIVQGNCEVQDAVIQAGKYRTQFVKDAQILCAAQKLNNAQTAEDTAFLFKTGKKVLSQKTFENIIDGWYPLEAKGVETKEDFTLKSLMKLPLPALELGDDISGILASSFFTNRATKEADIGLSRYEFYKQGAGVYAPYHMTYHDMDALFETKIADFANEVINRVNQNSSEKLLDKNENYTEYGEYVMDIVAQDIAKYALLKAFAGETLKPVVMPDNVNKGKITYNYSELRKNITLESLGINSPGQEEEAKKLLKIISEGLDKLTLKDIDFVSNAISKRIEGTTTSSFRLAEAIVDKAGLGLDFRLDAAKDVADMDAVRNGDMTFDEAWEQVISFWKKFVSEIKKINPNSYIVAEITDVDQLMKAQYGSGADVWEGDLTELGDKYKNVPDAINAFFRETGVTSEAAYSYTFTDLLHVFSPDAEQGIRHDNGLYSLKDRIEALLQNNNLDYIKNLWTFADNHDKPSILHTMALDMELFHTNNLTPNFMYSQDSFIQDGTETRKRNARIAIMQELTNSDSFEDLPLEAMMNINNINYFRTASPRSAAMSKLIRSAINEKLLNVFKETRILKEALVDLTNGNYLTDDKNLNIQTINIKELQTLENALDFILNNSDLSIDNETKQKIITLAKQKDFVEPFMIYGDFGDKTEEGNELWTSQILKERADKVADIAEDEYENYSPYVISVAALLLAAYKQVTAGSDVEKFVNGTNEFVHKFDRKTVTENSSILPYTESSEIAMKKKAYAARDIETVIEMLIQQAEYKTGEKFSENTKYNIMKNLFKSATEPAVKKALMYATFISALPGIPSQFYRDILGGLGYDEKAKNIFLQNRNTVKYSELEEGPLKEYRGEIFDSFRKVMRLRNDKRLDTINDGTPYILDMEHPNMMAMLYQGSGDNAVITIMHNFGLDTRNRVEYDNEGDIGKYIPKLAELELDEIKFPENIALPEDSIFTNIAVGDTVEYVVKKFADGIYRLVRKDGKKIILNDKTAKHGVMFLKKTSKIAFRGNVKQYNFVSDPYKKAEVHNLGKNLSITTT